MPRVVHFEYHCDDPERAAKFFHQVFGWKIEKWGEMDYWVVITGPDDEPGINGGLLRRRDPAGAVYNTVTVKDLKKTIADVEKAGGKIVVPTMAIPTIGWLAYFMDTEGNVTGIMQEDPTAK